jgi:hypothetical protein
MFVFGLAQLWQWVRPSEHQLTVTRPVGGTIVGGGIDCGSRGSTCTASVRAGDGIELRADPDAGYVLDAFTADCPPTGRLLMTQARTCGAIFKRVESGGVGASSSGTEWPLTILKPTGGTIVFGDILCGSLGEQCSARVPDGRQVALVFQTDPGYRFVAYTDDCAPLGETTMSGARTCGATFAKADTKTSSIDQIPEPATRAKPAARPAAGTNAQTEKPSPNPAAPSSPANPVQAPTPPSGGVTTPPQTTTPPAEPLPADGTQKPAEAPITAVDHAKKEITQLVNDYCAAYQAKNPAAVRKLFPLENEKRLRDLFRQYKSIKCAVTEPKFVLLEASGSNGAGSAQLTFEMKQTLDSESGGAPKVHETIATMRTSRKSNLHPWLIDGMEHEAKPK